MLSVALVESSYTICCFIRSVGEYPGAKTPTVDTGCLSWDFCRQLTSQVEPMLPDPVETVPADVFAVAPSDDESETDGANGDTHGEDQGAENDTSSSSSSGTDHRVHVSACIALSTIGIYILAMATAVE
jgi:hypothetical protein